MSYRNCIINSVFYPFVDTTDYILSLSGEAIGGKLRTSRWCRSETVKRLLPYFMRVNMLEELAGNYREFLISILTEDIIFKVNINCANLL